MKKSVSAIALCLFTAAILISCAPNTKSQMQQWDNNKKDLAEAVVKYPAFKTLLDQKMAASQKIWDDALKASKDEEKAKKMKEANDKLNELLNQFSQIKYKSLSINEALTKFNQKKLTKDEDRIRTSARADAFKALEEIEASLASAKPATEDEAKKITSDAISKLISTQGSLDRAIKSVEPQKAAKKK